MNVFWLAFCLFHSLSVSFEESISIKYLIHFCFFFSEACKKDENWREMKFPISLKKLELTCSNFNGDLSNTSIQVLDMCYTRNSKGYGSLKFPKTLKAISLIRNIWKPFGLCFSSFSQWIMFFVCFYFKLS